MCPSLPRDRRRAARHARPRQHAAPGAVRAARAGCAGSEAMADTLDLCVACKGCKRECPTGVDMARMKIEFLHQMRRDTASAAARPADRLSAALCAPCRRGCAGCSNLRNRVPGCGAVAERAARLQRRATAAALASEALSAGADRPVAGGRRPRRRAVRRHLHQLVRAGQRPGRGARCWKPAGYRVHAAMRRRRTPAVLRPHLPARRPGRRGPARGARTLAALAPLRRGRRARGRAGAVVPAHLARRVHRAAAGQRERCARRARAAVRGVPVARAGRRPVAPAAALEWAAPRAGAWPLPSEGVRRDGAPSRAASAWSRPHGRDDRVELLRHGRRIRLRGRAPRDLYAHGRTLAAAGRARAPTPIR